MRTATPPAELLPEITPLPPAIVLVGHPGNSATSLGNESAINFKRYRAILPESNVPQSSEPEFSSPRSTGFESFTAADSSTLSIITDATLKGMLELHRRRSQLLQKLEVWRESYVVPSQQFWNAASDVCINIGLIRDTLKPTIERHTILDEGRDPLLDLGGIFKETEKLICQSTTNGVKSRWPDIPTTAFNREEDHFGARQLSVRPETIALKLLDRIFMLKQRIFYHDALLTLHRHMWMGRDEQWEGFAREAESYWIRKSKLREAELVKDLARQEEDLQEVQEALRVLLQVKSSTNLPPREVGHPTLMAADADIVVDLQAKLQQARNDAAQSGLDPSIGSLAASQKSTQDSPMSSPSPPTWTMLAKDAIHSSWKRSVVRMSRQSLALSRLCFLLKTRAVHYKTPAILNGQSPFRTGCPVMATISEAEVDSRRAILHHGFSHLKTALGFADPRPAEPRKVFASAGVVLLGIIMRHLQNRRASQALQFLRQRHATESSNRHHSLVSLVTMTPRTNQLLLQQGPTTTETMPASTVTKRPMNVLRLLPRDSVGGQTSPFLPERAAKRTQNTARSLSPPQLQPRGLVGRRTCVSRGSSGEALLAEPGYMVSTSQMPSPSDKLPSAAKSARIKMLVPSEEIRRRQPPFHRPMGSRTASPTVIMAAAHTFYPSAFTQASAWSDFSTLSSVGTRPVALQTHRFLLAGGHSTSDVQKPRAIPPIRLSMHDWTTTNRHTARTIATTSNQSLSWR